MTAENNRGRKVSFVVLVIIVIVCIAAGVLFWRTQSVFPSAISEIGITADQFVRVNFQTRECFVVDLQVDEEGNSIDNSHHLILEEDALSDYYEYTMTFCKDVFAKKSKYTKRIGTDELQRRYWALEITSVNGESERIDGLSAFPAKWPEFIAKTNQLIGADHLSSDTEGLPLE